MTRNTNIYKIRSQIINRIVDHFRKTNSKRFFFAENLIQVTKIKKKKRKINKLKSLRLKKLFMS